MAEAFLFTIAESLLTKLASRAFEEASQLLGVYDDLREFQLTLSYIKALLLDAEQKQEHSQELREWLRQIKLVLYDAENVLDEVDCETLRKQVVRAYGTTKTKVGCFFSSSNPIVFRYKMAQQIKDIRKRLDRVAADRDKFGLQTIDVDRRVVHRRELTYSHVVESDVIGRDKDKEEIIQLLTEQNPNDDRSISVLPIVGIGGLGKTTLAKFVYSDKRITESFPLKMWVCVSDDFDIKQLVIKIINSASEGLDSISFPLGQQNIKELDMEQLANHLRNQLAGQKFLLVLDDVWNEDHVKWVELRDLIQVGAGGSKILVTTRSHTIASMMGTIPTRILSGLSFADSLSLFNKWAFKEGEEQKFPNLVTIGKEIVKKCKGVPLAVRTLGSSLFSKSEMSKWKFVRDNEIWNMPQRKDDILPALKLSYDQMPSYLRQCFALFSLYPKDHQFNSFMVASLWGAVGFLHLESQNKTLIDVANQYLYEFASRSFLQNFIDMGPYYSFTIHDLVHDLALYVAKDDCQIQNSHTRHILTNVLHLSFFDNNLLRKSFIPKLSGVRTILFPIEGVGVNDESLLNTWLSSCKYLRFLDLSDSICETLPLSIGKLKHLRYLSLMRNKKIKTLPSSICMLQNLQSFSVGGCTMLEELPKGLRNLISLQTLLITTKQSVFPDDDIANLSSLKHLQIESCGKLESLFLGKNLPSLKTLVVHNCQSLRILPLDINHFPQLETLMIFNCKYLEMSMRHDQGIENVNLMLKAFALESIPQLLTLPNWLHASADTLQSLWLSNCDKLEVLPEWLSSMGSLKSIVILGCPNLMSLPDDIHRLTTLEYLRIEGCPELCKRCQPQVVEYWTKISHIKKIDIKFP